MIGNHTSLNLNKKTYSVLCKHKNNQCLFVAKKEKFQELIEDQDEKLSDLLMKDYDWNEDKFIWIL